VTGDVESLLSTRVSVDGDLLVLTLAGELDCASAPELDAEIDAALRAHAPRRVVVDAERLTFVDVSGLRPLLGLAERFRAPGAFRLRNPTDRVTRVIRLLELEDVFDLR
jgi:anti-anti-sigma factor